LIERATLNAPLLHAVVHVAVQESVLIIQPAAA